MPLRDGREINQAKLVQFSLYISVTLQKSCINIGIHNAVCSGTAVLSSWACALWLRSWHWW